MGRAPVLTPGARDRVLPTLGVLTFFIVGYFGVGSIADPARARALAGSADARIPFLPGSVWLYLLVFPGSLLPLFLVRSQDLFRRAMAAYVAAIAVSLTAFLAFPVTSVSLRADAASLDRARFSTWAVAKLYAIDPPYNLFPSLHLSIATLAALTAWKARRAYGAAALCGVVLIGVSTLTVKQHFIADVAAGVALAGLLYAALLRPHTSRHEVPEAYGWQGPAAFLATIATAWGALYAWFRLGA